MKYKIRINRALCSHALKLKGTKATGLLRKASAKFYNAYENDILPLPYISLYSLIAAKILFKIQNKKD